MTCLAFDRVIGHGLSEVLLASACPLLLLSLVERAHCFDFASLGILRRLLRFFFLRIIALTHETTPY